MIAHIVIGFILMVLGAWLLHYAFNHWKYDTFCVIFGTIILAIGFLTTLWAPISVLDYNEFEVKYNIQQEMIEEFNAIPEATNQLIYTMNVLEVNEELAEMQASKQYWGWWSCIPDRVLELEPIGFNSLK